MVLIDAAPAGSPEAPQQSRLSRTETIEENLIALIRMTATVGSTLRAKGDAPGEDHVYLILALDNLFMLSQSILDEKTIETIEKYKKSVEPEMDKKKTIEAAETLIKALDARGISKFYEEEIEPPFMLEKVTV